MLYYIYICREREIPINIYTYRCILMVVEVTQKVGQRWIRTTNPTNSRSVKLIAILWGLWTQITSLVLSNLA